MSSRVRERFRGVNMGANATLTLSGANGIAGFLAKTAGTITVTVQDGSTGTLNTVTVVDAIGVTAGQFTLIPLEFPQSGGTVTLGGGASGTLFV